MIPDAKIWLTIAGLAAATYAIRASFLVLLAGRRLPEGLTRALGFVPVTVLPALIAPMVLTDGDGALAGEPATMAAGGLALAAGMATRNVLAGILGGIGGFALAAAVL